MNGYDNQYIGVFATAEDLKDSIFKDNIFINKENSIQYIVKSLSLPALPQECFAGYMSSFDEECEVDDDLYLNDEERIARFIEQMKDRLFVFTYKVKDMKYYNIVNAKLVPRPQAVDKNTMFISIPVFSSSEDEAVKSWGIETSRKLYRDYACFDEFIEKIRNSKSLGIVGCYELPSTAPSFVIWKGNQGELLAIGQINECRLDSLGGIILESKNLFSIDLSDYQNFFVYDTYINPTLMFIPQDIYGRIENRILQEAASRSEIKCVEQKVEKMDKNSEVITEPSNEELIHISTEEKNDILLLDCMKYHSQKMNLFYNTTDLINFHTAAKCSNLVILSGMSGTGKSALVDVYAKALGVSSKDDSLLFIPVRPSWNDDADLLGYVDLVHMVYRASDTGFVNLLVEAEKEANKNKLYLVCFDEMNLARVEHYFSQFLSLLEKPLGQRKLRLYDEQYSGRLYNSMDYPSTIMLGDNIKFIGTVNIDESTYHFSDKVLDRANVISLEILNYSSEWKYENFGTLPNVNWSAKEYNELMVKTEVNINLRKLLWEMHVVLQKASAKLGIGPRIVKSIETYLNNFPKDNEYNFCEKDGVDYQVVQRILTKVRGPENQLGKLLSVDDEDSLERVFVRNSHISDFTRSRKIIEQKRKELETYGYCI